MLDWYNRTQINTKVLKWTHYGHTLGHLLHGYTNHEMLVSCLVISAISLFFPFMNSMLTTSFVFI